MTTPRPIHIDATGAQWAHRLGAEAKARVGYATPLEVAKLCPFAPETPHARMWRLGWNGLTPRGIASAPVRVSE